MSTSPKLLIFLLFNILMRIGAYNLDHYDGKETTNLRRLVNLEKTQSEDAMEIIRSKPALLKRIVKSCSCGNRVKRTTGTKTQNLTMLASCSPD